jgi:tetratricopeptide (TPR) repeat protein
MGKLASDGSESMEYFKKVAESAPGSNEKEEALYRIAQYYFAKGKYATSISFFRQAMNQFGKGKWNIPTRYWLGQAYLNHGAIQPEYIDSAEIHYIQFLKLLPNRHYYSTMALEGLAKARLNKNQTEPASETINMALESAPDDLKPNLYFLSFLLARHTADTSGQKEYAEKILSKYPYSLESKYLKEKYPEYRPYLKFPGASKNHTGFALQLGAFSLRENAQKTAEELKAQNIDASIVIKEKNRTKLFLLQTGNFASRQNAENFGEQYLKPKGLSYYVVPKN